MPSRDIEQSLREDVEGYVQNRLGGLREEVARLQDQLNQAFARLSDRLSADAQSDAPVAVAIADHLRQARNRGIEEAAEGSTRARSSGDVAIIKAAVEALEEQQTQSDALSTLVNRAASFAPRVAFFVVRNERMTGWRARGLEGTVGDDAVREISLPLDSNTLVGEAARERRSWSGAPGSHADDHAIYTHFGGEPPQRLVAVPLVVREKAVAVLYADSAGQDSEAVNLEALETLVRVTGMAVELIAARRPQAGASPDEKPAAPREQEQQHAPEMRHEPERVEESTEPEPSFVMAEPEPAHAAAPEPEVADAPVRATVIEETHPAFESAPVEAAQATETDLWTGRSDVHGSPAEAAFPAQPETPAPRRRYGVEVELPIEVSEEERPVHDHARRFARLLVSEIKLYNEQKVKDGRDASDLYGRLRDDIDRSREMYDKRFGSKIGGRYDYFHHELVKTLADGDQSKLGDGYPGATASA